MFLREGTVETSEREEIYFWQHSRHGAVVELFTLITSPLMPAGLESKWPFRPCKASDVASVCCVLRVTSEKTEYCDRIFQNFSVTTHLTCCLQK